MARIKTICASAQCKYILFAPVYFSGAAFFKQLETEKTYQTAQVCSLVRIFAVSMATKFPFHLPRLYFHLKMEIIE